MSDRTLVINTRQGEVGGIPNCWTAELQFKHYGTSATAVGVSRKMNRAVAYALEELAAKLKETE